ncbi:hypothetical protein LJC32_00870 [Oscillospiraceae bacterium OttesenSCG-928-F05]|nr:hypothetical protein [Oscillospiraceae bacterium OttesenSCG-928-F05]
MDFYEKYSFVFEDKNLYSSPAWREAYTNYRGNHGRHGDNDPLEILVDVAGKSIAEAFSYAFLRKAIDSAVKDAVIKSGGKWTDD